jgi:hypothetical protein
MPERKCKVDELDRNKSDKPDYDYHVGSPTLFIVILANPYDIVMTLLCESTQYTASPADGRKRDEIYDLS